MSAIQDHSTDLSIQRVPKPVRFVNAQAALQGFKLVNRGWPFEELPDSDEDPVMTITGQGSGFAFESPWLEETKVYGDVAHLACALSAQLYFPMIAGDRSRLICHGAGAIVNGRLLLFPVGFRTGKSLLMAQLAYAGARIFADDVFFVSMETGKAIASGILPRLRRPLPDGVSDDFRAWVEARTVLAGRRYRYIDLSSDELCDYGEQYSIAGFIDLNRDDKVVDPRLSSYLPYMVLEDMLWQNFARSNDASRILDRVWSITRDRYYSTLTYSDGEAAADLLANLRVDNRANRATPHAQPICHRFGTAGSRRSRCNRRVSERLLDGRVFLGNDETQRIHRLDRPGTGVWRLLADGSDREEIEAVLATAFPEVSTERIATDLNALLAELDKCRLLEDER